MHIQHHETLVDKHARQHNALPLFEKQTFYGCLQHIYVVEVPANPALRIDSPETVFLAAILSCQLDTSPSRLNSLDIHLYSNIGSTPDIVDIVCVQCLVGQVPIDGGQSWAIINQSGGLACAVFKD
ncbi:hypothetical protein BV22DRAFT_1024605 [Leucogyrophana mollusca]|uniref:Uncharacterized protein n=1 Tax=Leucogyrophana mollusca TaxID=85980 RepID=A0ACB8B149_9AGAM|nr:hypothetical protein BV22DRAFT_1024605 [Leucogyrophana mollusca]